MYNYSVLGDPGADCRDERKIKLGEISDRCASCKRSLAPIFTRFVFVPPRLSALGSPKMQLQREKTRNSHLHQQENRQLSEPNLHQTTLPIDLKASVSQLVALELTKHSEDSKIHNKALAWLKCPPTASQLG